MDKKVLIKYLAGDATQEEKDAVALWLDASPGNMREFMSLRKLHDITIWQSQAGENRGKGRVSREYLFTPKVWKEAINPLRYLKYGSGWIRCSSSGLILPSARS